MAEEKTNVMRMLEQAGVAYTPHGYAHGKEPVDGVTVARSMGQDPGKVFKTTVPRTVKLSEAPGFGMPVSYFAKFNKGTWAYKGLAKEIINNNI